jgi:chromate transporter
MDKLKKCLKLFWVFFKVGSFTFGGGLAMLPLIQREVVDNNRWIKEEEILDVFAISQSVPGVIAVNSSIFIGKSVSGVSGSIAAVLGVVLPAFLSIIAALIALKNLQGNIYVEKIFSGIRAASAALILLSAVKLGKSAVKGKAGYVIALISFTIVVVFNKSAAFAVIIGGLAGYLLHFKKERAQL